MDPTISLKSALSLLLPQQTQAEDGGSVAQSGQAGTAETAAGAATIGAVFQDFFRTSSNLGVLGLHPPRNAGDIEAILAQVSLTVDQLASESDGLKGIARAVRRRNVLSEMTGNFANAAGLRQGIADKTVEMETKTATRDGMNGQLAALNAQASQLSAAIPGLEGDDKTKAEQALAVLKDQISTLSSEIGVLNDQLNVLSGEISDLNDALSVLNLFGDFLGSFILKAMYQTDEIQSEDTQEYASSGQKEEKIRDILPLLENIFEVRLEDEAIQEFIADNDLSEGDVEAVLEKAVGLLASVFSALETLIQSSDLAEFDPNAAAAATDKGGRLQIAL
ncbi:hypothetical protein C8N35_111140 [Breoghania corrubedonensis]|uniref:Uncharacterized protein n=1 Tax=Breoghania corrubedonensis TaxID=665038 RepID=A0A2T5UYV6_9HYPH|nr:hypothetical protein [Breoghania corrubedonensis]PTW56677.1 hypothetical protein C8N35_111140 [Breoghania corrubedonensis]